MRDSFSSNYAGAFDCDVSLVMNPDTTSSFPPNEEAMAARKGGKKSSTGGGKKQSPPKPSGPSTDNPLPGAGPGGTTGVGTVRQEPQPTPKKNP